MRTKRYLQMVYVQLIVQSCILCHYTEAMHRLPHASEIARAEDNLAHQQTLMQRHSHHRSTSSTTTITLLTDN